MNRKESLCVASPAARASEAAGASGAGSACFKILHDGQQAEFIAGERTWRVLGLDHNTSFDQLKVNVRVQHCDRFDLDTFDFCNARARASFLATAEQIIDADKAALEGDPCALGNHLEDRPQDVHSEAFSMDHDGGLIRRRGPRVEALFQRRAGGEHGLALREENPARVRDLGRSRFQPSHGEECDPNQTAG